MVGCGRGSWRLLGATLALLTLAGCGSDGAGGSDEGGAATSSGSTAGRPVAAPTSLSRLAKAGEHFVAVNPAWFADRERPELISTTDRVGWTTLPKLPEPVSSVGFGAADGQLVVLATSCETGDGVDVCAEDQLDDLTGVDAPLRAWVLGPDDVYDEVDLPDGLTVSAEAPSGTPQGTWSAIDTSGGLLLISADGRSRLLDDIELDLDTPMSYSLTGSRLVVIGYRGNPDAVKAERQMEYSSPEDAAALAELAGSDFALTSVSYVELDDPSAPPTTIEVPDEVPDLPAFVSQDSVVWVDDTHEYVIDLNTGAFSTAPLPAEVAPLASVVNPVGGRDGRASPDGTVYLTPDPAYGPVPPGAGVARRTPDGQWSIVSGTPIAGTPLVIADGGLFAVTRDSRIEKYSN